MRDLRFRTNCAPWLDCREWRYRRCEACGAAWLDPVPGSSIAEAYYDQTYFEGGKSGGYRDYLADELLHRRNARMRIALARRFGAAVPGQWLDVGCAAGFTLDEARKSGFRAFGVEVSAWARNIANARFRLPVVDTIATAQRQLRGPVDVASLFQALEHLADPGATLRTMRAVLRPQGLLLIETWDRGSLIARCLGRHWQQVSPPSVLWLLDRKSMTRALEGAGFDLLAIERTSKWVSVGWALGILATKLPGALAPAARAISRASLGRAGIRYCLGDLITVVAVARPQVPLRSRPGRSGVCGPVAARHAAAGR